MIVTRAIERAWLDLCDMPIKKARSIATVVLERIVAELWGEPCIAFEDFEPQRKEMAITRSSKVGNIMASAGYSKIDDAQRLGFEIRSKFAAR